MIENIIKSRVAIGSQVSRSRVVNSLRDSVCDQCDQIDQCDEIYSQGYSPFSIDRALSALTRRRDFDEKNQGKTLQRLR